MGKSIWTTILVRLGASIIGTFEAGCGSDSGHPPPAETGSEVIAPVATSDVRPVRTGPCATEGQAETCDVPTGKVGNIVNCFRGTQQCEGGVWTACGDPKN